MPPTSPQSPRTRAATRVAIVAALAVAAGAARAETALLVVGDGVTGPRLAQVEAQLRAARPYQAADVTNARLAGGRERGLSCDLRDVDCLVQLGVLCGASGVLLADVALGEVTLAEIDVERGLATRRARAVDVAAALIALHAEAATRARVVVHAPQGALVVVDDRAPTPGPVTLDDLAPGPHRARLGGVEATEQVVTAVLGEEVAVTLAAPAPKDAARWWVAGGGGALALVGAAVAVGGAVLYGDRQGSAGDLLALDDGAPLTPERLEAIQQARSRFESADATWQQAGVPLLAVGAVVAGAGLGALATALVVGGE